MREALPLARDAIAICLEDDYGVKVDGVHALPLGADVDAAAYRVTTQRDAFFLKCRHGAFDAATVCVPHWLARTGMRAIVAPVATRSGTLWVQRDGLTFVLYPLVEGRSGWEVDLSRAQWHALGASMRQLHDTALPATLLPQVLAESYLPRWRDRVGQVLDRLSVHRGCDAAERGLYGLLRRHESILRRIIARAAALADALRRQPPDLGLSHGDLHAGNVLIDAQGAVHIVDWDGLMLAPRERDLMFIGGGVGGIWNRPDEVRWFYEGYGVTQIDPAALSYYRLERIVQDAGETCEALQSAHVSDDARLALVGHLATHFGPGSAVEVAHATDTVLRR